MAQRVALLALLVAPSIAAAQITVSEGNDQDGIINIVECQGTRQDNLQFTWTIPANIFTGGGSYDLLASDQSGCPLPSTNNTAHTQTIGPSIQASSATGTFPASGQTYNVQSLLAVANITNCSSQSTNVFLCVNYTPSGGVAQVGVLTGNVRIDLATPPAPVANTPGPGDSALNVSWSQGPGSSDAGAVGAANGYNVYFTTSGAGVDVRNTTDPAVKKATVTSAGTLSTRLDGLTNGVTYDVIVTALSIGSNESNPQQSNVVQGTPQQVNDFWRLYKQDGGRETGGCATGAAGMAALLLVPLALRARRRRS